MVKISNASTRAHRTRGRLPPTWEELAAGDVEGKSERAAQARLEARRTADVRGEAAAVELLGLVASARGDREEAVARYRNVIEQRHKLGIEDLGAFELARLGGILHDLDRPDEAIVHLEAACAAATRGGDTDAEREAVILLAQVYVERGDHELALEKLLLGHDLATATNALDGLAWVAVMRGWLVELRSGSLAEASVHYNNALDLGRRCGRDPVIALGAASLAYARAACGASGDEVAALLAEAEQRAAATMIPNVAPSVAVRRWMCHARASDVRASELASRIAHASRHTILQSETRIALRCLERLEADATAFEPLRRGIEVALGGTWFRVAGHSEISLARRPSLARILAKLASGARTPWDALLAAGWPDEHVPAEAGFGRVRSAAIGNR